MYQKSKDNNTYNTTDATITHQHSEIGIQKDKQISSIQFISLHFKFHSPDSPAAYMKKLVVYREEEEEEIKNKEISHPYIQ